MTVQRREFLSELGVFAAAGAMGPVMRAFAAVADDAAHPLDAYWAAHLSAVAEKVRVHAKTATDGFWFITDLHVTANCRQSGKALVALTSLTPLRKTFCGGDIPGAFGERFESDKAAVDFAVDAFHSFWRDPIERAGQRLYMAKGNHDFTIKHDAETSAGYTYSAEAARAIVMGSKGCAEAVTNDADLTACYYYVDQEAAKIRYIVADTSDSIDATRSWWAVAEGLLHLPLVFVSLHRAPLALALNHLLGHLPWRLRSDNDDICLVSLAKESSLAYLEELGWLMCHQLYHSFDGEHAFVHQLEHGNEGELNHRHA